jgi:hypothetical protein
LPREPLNSKQRFESLRKDNAAAKDVLLDLHADILCLQEVRDWDSVAEPVSILPGLQPLVVSRFREMGSSNPANRYRFALAG